MCCTGNYFLGTWILDLLWWENVPIRVQATRLFLHIVNENTVCGIRTEDESVDMGQLISLTWDFLLDQMVCLVISENSMDFLGTVATDVWSKHDTAWKHLSKTQFTSSGTFLKVKTCFKTYKYFYAKKK